MHDLEGIIAILCIFVILPGMAMYFADRRRRSKDVGELESRGADVDLVRIADRMERRVDALEKILDAEAPGWRSRHHG